MAGKTLLVLTCLLAGSAGAAVAQTAPDTPPSPSPTPLPIDSGRLLATGGLTQLEGAAGGGIAPWAVIAGYGTRDAIGATVHGTTVLLPDFQLTTTGIAVGLYDRVELSYAHQWFDTGSTGRALGIGAGYMFEQDIYGAKVRLFGDAVYDQDSLLPQVSVGAQYKVSQNAPVLHAIGARGTQGADFYLAATKLLLAQSLLLNATVLLTRDNQIGILGFGGDRNNGYQAEFAGSAALLLNRHLAVGVEYRTKPDNLGFAHEDNWFDAFLAYFITKNVSAALAYVDLGSIATRKNQRGAYLSLQVGF